MATEIGAQENAAAKVGPDDPRVSQRVREERSMLRENGKLTDARSGAMRSLAGRAEREDHSPDEA